MNINPVPRSFPRRLIAALSLSAVVLSALALPASARPQAQPQAAAPDAKLLETPAGRIAAEFIKIFNSGTDEEFLQFFTKNGSEGALTRRTDEDRLRMNRQMKSRLGRLTVRSVKRADDTVVTLDVETEKAGWATIEFVLEAKPPRKLDSVMVVDQSDPEYASALSGAATRPAPPPSDEELGRRLSDFVVRAEAFGFTGGVLLARNDRIILERGCGLADRSRRIPVTPDTAFDIGSNTKDFTKMAVLQLADRGKIRLDDPLTKFFPGVPADKAAITIAMLMDHTAGLPLYSGPDDEVITRDDFLKRILAARLLSPPGKDENYSNPGYALLAAVIERVTGQSYEQCVSENIFKPAGMSQTGYALPKWKPGQIARAYSEGQDTGSTFDYAHAPDGPYWNLRGNGGTLATLRDMYKFHRALAGDALLGKVSKDRLFPQTAPVVLVGGNGIHNFVYHREPADGLAVLVASTDAGMRAMDLDRALVGIALGRDVELPPAVTPLAAEAMDQLAGIYTLPSGAKFIVTSRKDRLAVVAYGQEAMNLLAGLGPEAAAEAERLNARALVIAEAAARGDYGPLAEAFGGRIPPAELKARNEKVRQERETRFGPFKGLTILGTVPGQTPRGRKTSMEPPESATIIAHEFERGTAYSRFLWGQEGLVGARGFDVPPATEFLPISVAEFASYSLATGAGTRIAFEVDAAGRATGLSFVSGDEPVTAKRAS